MERLTKTYSDGTHGAADNLPCGENSYEYKGLLLEALGKYEDAEEQGLLLRVPCKVGQEAKKVIEKYKAEALEDIEAYGEDAVFGYCPVCGNLQSDVWNTKYCGDCGQRLDWSGEE